MNDWSNYWSQGEYDSKFQLLERNKNMIDYENEIEGNKGFMYDDDTAHPYTSSEIQGIILEFDAVISEQLQHEKSLMMHRLIKKPSMLILTLRISQD